MPGDPPKLALNAPNSTIKNKSTPLLGFRPYEALYGGPFLSTNLLLDEGINQVIKFITLLASYQWAIQKLGLESVLPITTPSYMSQKSAV